MYATLVLYTHDSRCYTLYCDYIKYTEASSLNKVGSSLIEVWEVTWKSSLSKQIQRRCWRIVVCPAEQKCELYYCVASHLYMVREKTFLVCVQRNLRDFETFRMYRCTILTVPTWPVRTHGSVTYPARVWNGTTLNTSSLRWNNNTRTASPRVENRYRTGPKLWWLSDGGGRGVKDLVVKDRTGQN